MNIIGKRYIFFTISGILILASVAAVLGFGLKEGIDFKGGSLWQVKFIDQSPDKTQLANFFATKLNMGDAFITQGSANNVYIIRMKETSESDHQNYLTAIKGQFGNIDELGFQSIGPSIGGELRQKAIMAVILVLVGISLYIAFAFRKVSYPVKSWKYGVITLLTLFHDIVIPIGLLAVLGWKLGVEIDTNFIVALLVVMGFSVHDTIVVFDRIRENLTLNRSKESFKDVINKSVNETMARSINTSLTLFLVLATLLFFGPFSLKYFSLIILVGTMVGTYSSIFIASPSLLLVSKNTK